MFTPVPLQERMGCGCWTRMITQSGRLKLHTLLMPWVIKTTLRFRRPRNLIRLEITQFLRPVRILVAAQSQLMQKLTSSAPLGLVEN